jgi:hypothetical protein
MGLQHEFFLITEDEYKEMSYDDRDYSLSKDSSDIAVIHDDIIQYIYDTLRWIPSINPAINYAKGFGLYNWGVTLFDKEGAEVLFNIAKAWADLFLNGPTTLKLTGNYSWGGEKDVEDGEYEIIEIARDELVENLRKLQSFAEQVMVNSNKYYILHHGI